MAQATGQLRRRLSPGRGGTRDQTQDVTNTRPLSTVSWHELEDWQRDNEYILRGYRRCVVLEVTPNVVAKASQTAT